MAARTFLIIFLTTFFIAACTTPVPVVRTDQYHDKIEKSDKENDLNGLQLKALQLMNQLKFQQAILFLQRAIKVEPRNPLNWHYLAQNYWHLNEFGQCRSMVQRAISYSQFDLDLNRANRILLKQCEG